MLMANMAEPMFCTERLSGDDETVQWRRSTGLHGDVMVQLEEAVTMLM